MRSLILGLLLAGTFRVGCDCGPPAPPGPTHDPGPELPVDLSLAYTHGCRLELGVVSCFGTAPDGGLGVGDFAPRQSPTPVSAPNPFVSVVAAGMDVDGAACALDATGDVWCWGANDMGQLGLGDYAQHSPVPHRVSLPVKIRKLGQALFSVFCAIGVDGTLWCWGQNDEGQIGMGEWPPAPNPSTPVQVGTDTDWLEVSASEGHVCGIRDGGATYCWGRNTEGHLGTAADAGGQIRSPRLVPGTFNLVSAGENGTCAIGDSRLYCWGGIPGVGTQYGPLELLPGHIWRDVRLNTFHACALDDEGRAWCFGRNNEGQLGLGDNEDRDAATVLPGQGFSRVVTGRFGTCVQGDAGIFCTGDNSFGELGLGDAGLGFNTLQRQP